MVLLTMPCSLQLSRVKLAFHSVHPKKRVYNKKKVNERKKPRVSARCFAGKSPKK
jgi:hypothetical protein